MVVCVRVLTANVTGFPSSNAVRHSNCFTLPLLAASLAETAILRGGDVYYEKVQKKGCDSQ